MKNRPGQLVVKVVQADCQADFLYHSDHHHGPIGKPLAPGMPTWRVYPLQCLCSMIAVFSPNLAQKPLGLLPGLI